MKRGIACIGLGLFFPSLVLAKNAVTHLDPAAFVIFWVTLLFFLGLVGRYIATRLSQPGVLGELLMGVIIGNVGYFLDLQAIMILREGAGIFDIMGSFLAGLSLPNAVTTLLPNPGDAKQVITALHGPYALDLIKLAYVMDVFSRYGVIFLLFMVGLDTSINELKKTGAGSFRVALIGVFAPTALGLGVMSLVMPSLSFQSDLFIAATLSATSVGITARVLKDMKQLHMPESKTILGAAMIDDVLGLIILALVSSLVISGTVSFIFLVKTTVLAVVFLGGVVWLGPWFLKRMLRFFQFLEPWEAKLCVSFLFLMALAWIATWVQLATIIGAFAAGVVMHEGLFDSPADKRLPSIKALFSPLEALLAPLFFVLMGIQVKVGAFLNWHVLAVAAALLLAAIIGKLISGWGATRGNDRLLIGVGMLPRGEVGLVFASIGKTVGVISDALFASIVLMVIATTCIAPWWLKRRFTRKECSLHAAQ